MSKTYNFEFTEEELLAITAIMSIGATMLNDKYNYFDTMADGDIDKVMYAKAMMCVMDNISVLKNVNEKFKAATKDD